MLSFEMVLKNDRLMKSLTGLSREEFEVLLPTFEQVWKESLASKERQRAVGGGLKGLLPDASHKLLYILFYMKTYPTFDVAGFVFGAVRSACFAWTKKFLPVLEKALGRTVTLPKRQIRSVDEFFQLCPDAKDLFIDGTERPIQRPRKQKLLRRRYSGKKKRHTRKNTIICNEKKEILFVSPSKDGRVHDLQQLKKSAVVEHIPPDKAIWVDKAFCSIEKILKNGNTVMIPHKKPRKCKKELPPDKKEKREKLWAQQNAENKIISGIRIVVEHAIGGIKRFRCMTDPFRNKLGKDDQMIVIAAALWNLHLACSK
ncbi:hypothetical protein FACS189472_09490 [Alphaproteobacteria bacterium]|nr:hypothetical protein FACS189472_09490 [Alphaproteobacteria bacterium]